jgi:hypothetical protein
MSEKKMTGREVLEEALRGCCSAYCDQYPRYEGELDLGDDYERYMNRLIKRSKNPFQRYFNTVGKRIAGIAVAAFIVLGCFMAVPSVRESTCMFLADNFAKFAEVILGKNGADSTRDKLETVYTLGMIPNGYVVEEFIITDIKTDMLWRNTNGERIILSQSIFSGTSIFDTEDSLQGALENSSSVLDYTIIERNDKKIAFSKKNGIKTFFWNDGKSEFLLTVPNSTSVEEALMLIDSMIQYG